MAKRKRAGRGGGVSGLHKNGMMNAGLGANQDGFNLTDRVTQYHDLDCSDHFVGRDDADQPLDKRFTKLAKI